MNKKNLQHLLTELNACDEAKKWSKNYTIEQAVAKCYRGDWLLWLAKKLDLPLNKLTLAKARCAKTVVHLMKDQRSVNAVNIAEKFGLDECSLEELNVAAAAYAATVAYVADAAAASAADYADAYANANTDSSNIIVTIAARKNNKKQTADICREILGELIINKVNSLL